MVSADTFILKRLCYFFLKVAFNESVSAAGPFECLMIMYFFSRINPMGKMIGLGEAFCC